MPATSMLSSVQKALRNLLIGDDEVLPARGCSRADGVAFVSCEFLLLREVPETG